MLLMLDNLSVRWFLIRKKYPVIKYFFPSQVSVKWTQKSEDIEGTAWEMKELQENHQILIDMTSYELFMFNFDDILRHLLWETDRYCMQFSRMIPRWRSQGWNEEALWRFSVQWLPHADATRPWACVKMRSCGPQVGAATCVSSMTGRLVGPCTRTVPTIHCLGAHEARYPSEKPRWIEIRAR